MATTHLPSCNAGDERDGASALRDAGAERLLARINYERTTYVPYSEQHLKLDRMKALLARLGNPHHRVKIVHVAGTKGKGSTAAMISSVLSASGYCTGLFTSPHFQRIEQRFVVDGQPATSAELAAALDRLWPAVEAMDAAASRGSDLGRPTFFEITTALAWLHFAARRVDLAVMEVGLGGRLDATNVCHPLVSVITSISFDHTQQLGNTLGKIAREKAGIIKAGVPVVCGVECAEPRDVIQRAAEQHKAPLIQIGRDFRFQYYAASPSGESTCRPTLDFVQDTNRGKWETSGLELALLGRHQAHNAAVALAALDRLQQQGWSIPDQAVRNGLHTAWLPGRVEVVGQRPTVVVDAAHNVASAAALVDTLREHFSPRERVLLLATTRGKDVPGMLEVLANYFDRIVVTRYHSNPRATPLDELDALAARFTQLPHCAFENPQDAWDHVCRTATADQLICVTGSFFIAADIGEIIARCANHCKDTALV